MNAGEPEASRGGVDDAALTAFNGDGIFLIWKVP